MPRRNQAGVYGVKADAMGVGLRPMDGFAFVQLLPPVRIEVTTPGMLTLPTAADVAAELRCAWSAIQLRTVSLVTPIRDSSP